MAIKPILFNTEMVRAILDGRKTCTRRVIKLPENMNGIPVGKSGDSNNPLGFMYPGGIKRPLYQPGDILYVRETWKKAPNGYYYYEDWQRNDIADITKWKPSIHMPKEAARIWLKVTDVRVERLQEITEEQAKLEGCNSGMLTGPCTARGQFENLWNSTIKKPDLDQYGWDANPWVWVIEFERCEKPAESPYAWNDAIHKLTKGV